MIVRSLKQEQYDLLCRQLLETVPANPFDASRTVTMNVDGDSYALKLQPEKSYRIALLQAVRADRRHSPPELYPRHQSARSLGPAGTVSHPKPDLKIRPQNSAAGGFFHYFR